MAHLLVLQHSNNPDLNSAVLCGNAFIRSRMQMVEELQGASALRLKVARYNNQTGLEPGIDVVVASFADVIAHGGAASQPRAQRCKGKGKPYSKSKSVFARSAWRRVVVDEYQYVRTKVHFVFDTAALH